MSLHPKTFDLIESRRYRFNWELLAAILLPWALIVLAVWCFR